MTQRQTRIYAVSASEEVLERFERFLAMLNYNSMWGHSGTFCMPLDGDGSESFIVDMPNDRQFSGVLRKEVELCSSIGGDFEIANTKSFTVKNSKDLGSSWVVKDGKLYKNGEEYK